MQAQIRDMQGTAVAGGLVVLAGVAVWRLGIEFERAWMRSYDGPMLGDAFVGDGDVAAQHAQIGQAVPATGERRRWVAPHHPRVVRRTGHLA